MDRPTETPLDIEFEGVPFDRLDRDTLRAIILGLVAENDGLRRALALATRGASAGYLRGRLRAGTEGDNR